MPQNINTYGGVILTCALVQGAGFACTTTTTWGVYTIEQIVTALTAQGIITGQDYRDIKDSGTGVAPTYTFLENAGGTELRSDSTYGGYLIETIVAALQRQGIMT